MIFMIESLLFCQFHILVGIFHYRTWLVYSNDGLPQNFLGLCEQGSWMHTHFVFLLSFHTFIALVHPLHGNISRNDYGNAIIGRYGVCFEEDIRRCMLPAKVARY